RVRFQLVGVAVPAVAHDVVRQLMGEQPADITLRAHFDAHFAADVGSSTAAGAHVDVDGANAHGLGGLVGQGLQLVAGVRSGGLAAAGTGTAATHAGTGTAVGTAGAAAGAAARAASQKGGRGENGSQSGGEATDESRGESRFHGVWVHGV